MTHHLAASSGAGVGRSSVKPRPLTLTELRRAMPKQYRNSVGARATDLPPPPPASPPPTKKRAKAAARRSTKPSQKPAAPAAAAAPAAPAPAAVAPADDVPAAQPTAAFLAPPGAAHGGVSPGTLPLPCTPPCTPEVGLSLPIGGHTPPPPAITVADAGAADAEVVLSEDEDARFDRLTAVVNRVGPCRYDGVVHRPESAVDPLKERTVSPSQEREHAHEEHTKYGRPSERLFGRAPSYTADDAPHGDRQFSREHTVGARSPVASPNNSFNRSFTERSASSNGSFSRSPSGSRSGSSMFASRAGGPGTAHISDMMHRTSASKYGQAPRFPGAIGYEFTRQQESKNRARSSRMHGHGLGRLTDASDQLIRGAPPGGATQLPYSSSPTRAFRRSQTAEAPRAYVKRRKKRKPRKRKAHHPTPHHTQQHECEHAGQRRVAEREPWMEQQPPRSEPPAPVQRRWRRRRRRCEGGSKAVCKRHTFIYSHNNNNNHNITPAHTTGDPLRARHPLCPLLR